MAIDYPVPPQNFNVAGNLQSKGVRGSTLASAATIAPTFRFHHVSGTTPIATITPPWDDFSGGLLVLVADGNFSFLTSGNILTALSVVQANTVIILDYDPVVAKWTVLSAFNPATAPGGAATQGSGLLNIRQRTAVATVNTGFTILPAVAGLKWRLVEVVMISEGGAAATATHVDVRGTQSAAGVNLVHAAVATLTQDAVVKMTTANVLAAGASYAQCDVNTAITGGSTTNNLSGTTFLHTVTTAALEP